MFVTVIAVVIFQCNCYTAFHVITTVCQIQESTKTRIRFQGESQKDEDRILVIRGTQDAVHQAELMVRKVIVDQPPIVSDTVTVPANSVGRIIGELCLLHGAHRSWKVEENKPNGILHFRPVYMFLAFTYIIIVYCKKHFDLLFGISVNFCYLFNVMCHMFCAFIN